MATHSDVLPATVIAVSSVFTFLAVTAVGARLVSRLVIIKHGGRDEIAIVISMLSALVMFIAVLLEVKYGLGRHISTLTPQEIENQLRALWIFIIGYNSSLTLTKIAIVLQYFRILPSDGMRRICWATMVLIGIYGSFTLFTAIFSCSPTSAFWTGKGICRHQSVIWIIGSVLNILTDLIILIVPMPVFSSLRLPRRQKIGVILVFALGGFVTIVSFLRINSLYITATSKDITYDNFSTTIWSLVEIDVGIVCACLPTVKPVLSTCFPQSRSPYPNELPTMPYRYRGDNLNSNVQVSVPLNKLAELESNITTKTTGDITEERIENIDVEYGGGNDQGRGYLYTDVGGSRVGPENPENQLK